MASVSFISRRTKVLLILGIPTALLVAGYFTICSAGFLRAVILPRLGPTLGATITVGDAEISPFSAVTLRNLKIVPTGEEPLIEAQEVRLQYSLMKILQGHLEVSEAVVSGATVSFVEKPDGTSNLDPMLKAQKKSTPRPPSKSTSTTDLRNVALRNATLRRIRILPNNQREVTELSGLTLAIDRLANGAKGTVKVATDLKTESNTPAGVIQAKADGTYQFSLNSILTPIAVTGKMRIDVTKAEGAFQPFASLAAVLDCDVDSTDVKNLGIRFEQAGQSLGQIRVTGPFDSARGEGRLKLLIPRLDRQVLNLIGASSGIDFAGTVLSSTNTVDVSNMATMVSLSGQVQAAPFSLKRNGHTTTPADLRLGYGITVDRTEGSVVLRSLSLAGTRDQTVWLQGTLARPMTVVPGKATGSTDSTFDLAVTGLDLVDWRGFTGDTITSGRLGATVKTVSQNGGKQLKIDLTANISDLAATVKTNSLTQGRLSLAVQGQVDELKRLTVNRYALDLTQRGQPAFKASGNALFDKAAGSVYLQSAVEAVAAQLFGGGPSTVVKAGIRFDGALQENQFTLKDFEVAFNPTDRAPKNELHVSGKFDLTRPQQMKGSLDVKADALDLTETYDLFTAGQGPVAKGHAATPATSASRSIPTEPEAVFLPLKDFHATLAITRLFLHEVAVSNWTARVSIDGGKVVVNPFQLSLNAAPVNASADLNLESNGYAYDLALNMDRVPVEPLANTFLPEYRGQYQGELFARVKVKGAGTTGVNLRKSLGGQINLTFTNANLQLASPRAKTLMTPVAAALRVPDLLSTPLNWLNLRVLLGDGKIGPADVHLESPAFQAEIHDTIPIADILDQSSIPSVPVDFLLSSYLAKKSNLMPPGAPQNTAYVKLPTFVTLAGTLQSPAVVLDKAVLLQLGVKSIDGLGDGERKLIDAVGGLIGRRSGATNAPAAPPK